MSDRTTILVIDDDAAVTDFLRTYLEDEGFAVRIAGDGLRVLEQLQEEGDGALPVPVVIITGSTEGARRCRELLDHTDVIEKPFDPGDLLARIEANLGGREPT